jgi:hypothetical protein
MPITVKSGGSFRNTEAFLKRMQQRTYLAQLAKFGPMGVTALKGATPVDSGKTADGWYYEIVDQPGYFSIHWLNSHIEEPGHIPVAVLIQYGHGTRQGGYVQGRDYINPAIRGVFDQIAADMWKEVTR